MSFSPYASDLSPDEAGSMTLQRYALMKQMAAQANVDPAGRPNLDEAAQNWAQGGPAIVPDEAPAIVPDEAPAPAPAPATPPQTGQHQRGDIVRMPDGSLRLIKQPPTP